MHAQGSGSFPAIQDEGVRAFVVRAAAGLEQVADAVAPLAAASLLRLAAARLRSLDPGAAWPAHEGGPLAPMALQGQLAASAHMCRVLASWLEPPIADVASAPAHERQAGARLLIEAALLLERGAGLFGPDAPRPRTERVTGAFDRLVDVLFAE